MLADRWTDRRAATRRVQMRAGGRARAKAHGTNDPLT